MVKGIYRNVDEIAVLVFIPYIVPQFFLYVQRPLSDIDVVKGFHLFNAGDDASSRLRHRVDDDTTQSDFINQRGSALSANTNESSSFNAFISSEDSIPVL